jgi:hypothetical protein
MKVTLSYGLKLPIPGIPYSNKEVHATAEVEVKNLDETATIRASLKTLIEAEVKALASKPAPSAESW